MLATANKRLLREPQQQVKHIDMHQCLEQGHLGAGLCLACRRPSQCHLCVCGLCQVDVDSVYGSDPGLAVFTAVTGGNGFNLQINILSVMEGHNTYKREQLPTPSSISHDMVSLCMLLSQGCSAADLKELNIHVRLSKLVKIACEVALQIAAADSSSPAGSAAHSKATWTQTSWQL